MTLRCLRLPTTGPNGRCRREVIARRLPAYLPCANHSMGDSAIKWGKRLASTMVALGIGAIGSNALAAPAATIPQAEGRLKKLTACFAVSPPFHTIESIDRRKADGNTRLVSTLSGDREVSAVDDFRVLLKWASGGPAVNTKIEP